jgi:hypothetical protein
MLFVCCICEGFFFRVETNAKFFSQTKQQTERNMLAVRAAPTSSSSSTPPVGPPTVLRNADFRQGTYRIVKPGLYVLGEDITFEPDSFTPTGPQYAGQAYVLGFFAAITIECDDVTVDLNMHTLQQSKAHRLAQRFFALIELAASPFVPTQGPANFGTDLHPARNVWIVNGTLGRSSHHGIHGNNNVHVHVLNVCVEQFEIAGIALNGVQYAQIEQCRIGPAATDVPVSAAFSQATFLLPVLDGLDGAAVLRPGTTVGSVREDLRAQVDATRARVLAGQTVQNSLFFIDGLTDGTSVGIQIHSPGVAIKAFQEDWSRGMSSHVSIKDVDIVDLCSKTREVPGMYREESEEPDVGYSTAPVNTGVFGAVIPASIVNDGVYQPNALVDGLFAAYKFGGKGKIDAALYDWAMGVPDAPAPSRFVYGMDSMAHVIKGNMSIFLSGCRNFAVENVLVDGNSNKGNGEVRGIMLATCAHGRLKGVTIQNLTDHCRCGVEAVGQTAHVVMDACHIRLKQGPDIVGTGIEQTGAKNLHWRGR